MSRHPDVFIVASRSDQDLREPHNPFAGTRRITLPQRRAPAIFHAFAADPRRVQSYYDADVDCALYLLGHAAHRTVAASALMPWSVNVVRQNSSLSQFRDLYGNFVLIVEDRARAEISFVSDVMGVRPWFTGDFEGRLVAGSDVLSICDAGLSRGQVDYDAVSCWLRYNQEMAGGSVVRDYRNLAPGSVSTFDRCGRMTGRACYAHFEVNDQVVSEEQVADDLHQRVSAAFTALTRNVQTINLPLSGGFDSRYLAALAASQNRVPFTLTTIQTSAHETTPARRVAQALEQPLRIIPIDRNVLDLFDDPFVFAPAGFPTGRNLTSALARRHPGVPLLSGYLGDGLMRASLSEAGNKYFELEARRASLDELTDAADKRFQLKINRIDLLGDAVAKNVTDRARRTLSQVMSAASACGKPQTYADLYHRQRFYFANIFLQHMDAADALVPYACWDLLCYRMSHARKCYSSQTYHALFRRHFPRLADIPHSSVFEKNNHLGNARVMQRPTRHLRRWSNDLLRGVLAGSTELSTVCRARLLSLLPSGLLAQSQHQTEIIFLRKLHAFEQRLALAGIRFDWNAL